MTMEWLVMAGRLAGQHGSYKSYLLLLGKVLSMCGCVAGCVDGHFLRWVSQSRPEPLSGPREGGTAAPP